MSNAAVRHLRDDPALRAVIDEHGPVSVEPAEDPFQRLVVSIVNQQLSSASAAAIRERLFEAFEVRPEPVLAADPAALRETGLSAQKVRYVRNVAEAYRDGRIDPERFASMDDAAVTGELTDVTGIGTWTAKMFLIFCLGREDVFPVEDLGVRKGMRALYDAGMSREAMVETAEAWRPYRSYATRYLWLAYDG